MVTNRKYVEITDSLDLVKLAEEVSAAGEPTVLRHDGKDLAIITPIHPAPKRRKRERAFTKDDSLWDIVGIGSSAQRTDTSQKHELLAKALRRKSG